ncbi:uncharacterized protein LOC9654237 isoform X1 [Selaginella moellendorffii]|uniref:uncharacterized protein LOC9654237 isoform X1 n=1 Tax=Selaginella moellendorffii TaxID=88036 RepID=UPI000D1CFB8E|nr:uncharacterized protein LOC9654237 isoform X1 [Selaginella moellendorffii]|eukprot:XP_024524736.1 uncharacterized protein LOC9654237 isoform X1 [Selaginella moellendorffii]
MAAPASSTPFQPYVYQSEQSAAATAFQIFGFEAQILQIMLKPQEKIQAKSGSMCYTSGSIQAEVNVPQENAGVGVLQWMMGRPDTSTTFTNAGSEDGYIGLGAPSLARILPIDLAVFGGEIICQREAFLGSVNDVTVKHLTPRRVRVGYFGADVGGLLTQKLVGQGLAFITAGGSVLQKKLTRGELLVVDIGCLVAMTSAVECEIKQASPAARRAFFGGECPFQAHLTGPGVVFIQSLPSQRLAHKIARTISAPHFRDNPRFFISAGVFLFLAYAMIFASLLLAEP